MSDFPKNLTCEFELDPSYENPSRIVMKVVSELIHQELKNRHINMLANIWEQIDEREVPVIMADEIKLIALETPICNRQPDGRLKVQIHYQTFEHDHDQQCYGCDYYYGRIHNHIRTCCAVHPSGPEQADCPDFLPKKESRQGDQGG